ncbi:MAG: DUF72 domain-containing protein [Acidimicrobiia bacterium]
MSLFEDVPLHRGGPAATDPAAVAARRSARLLIGTSGYSFADWVGPFYPQHTRPSDFLSYYARHFDAVEINATYYRIPSIEVIARMERKTPPGFHFVVKLNQAMTHEGSQDADLYRSFRAVLDPLKSAGKYDGLLAQFPWSFKRSPENERRLSQLREQLSGEPIFVEFRHDSWIREDLAHLLEKSRLGFCAVDEPDLEGLLPPLTLLTAEDAYVRFHGRNARNWWSSGEPSLGDRYDYDYRADELREWVGKIRELADRARRTYLFFNNCHAGQAARSAKLMQEMLRQESA